jgi:hypothetical protein
VLLRDLVRRLNGILVTCNDTSALSRRRASVRDGIEWSLLCAECGRTSDALARGWRGYRTDLEEDGDPPELAFFCASCAEFEFGDE